MNNLGKYDKYINNIFRLDSYGTISIDRLDIDDGFFTDINGVKLEGFTFLGGSIENHLYDKPGSEGIYFQLPMGDDWQYYASEYNVEEKIGFYDDYMIFDAYEDGKGDFYLKGKNIIITGLSGYDWRCETAQIYEEKCDSFPCRVKIPRGIKNGVFELPVDTYVKKVKTNIGDLIMEVLKEQGLDPTREEIIEIVKNSAFKDDKKAIFSNSD